MAASRRVPIPVASALARTAVFGKLPDADLAALAGRCTARAYAKGQVVITEGDPGDAMFVVASGMLRVLTCRDDGSKLVLTTLHPPDVFGEIALLDSGLRSASVEAVRRSDLVLLRRDALIELVGAHPAITEALFVYLGGLVRRLTRQTADLAFLDLQGRIAKLLAGLAEARGEPTTDGVVIDLGLSQSDIAAMVGGSRQSVNQTLRTFERRGWMQMRGGRIVVHRLDELRRRGPG